MKAAGVEKVFRDEGVSGSLASRPALDELLTYIRPEDTLVVWRLDRLGRNTRNLLALLDDLEERGVKFRSLTEGLDTGGAMGRVMVTIISAFAQMERDTIRERTQAGLVAARARGRVGGRPAALTAQQHKMVRALYEARELTIKQIAEEMGVSDQTIYRSLNSTKPAADVVTV